MVDGVSDGRLLESSRCCSSGAVEQDRKQETLYEAWNTGGISQFTAFVNFLSGVRILKVKLQKPVWERFAHLSGHRIHLESRKFCGVANWKD